MNNDLQERIGYHGDLSKLLSTVCKEYQIGTYVSHSAVLMGYEDFNLIVETTHHKFFFKIFASFRDRKNCERYIEIIGAARNAGISQPEIYESSQGRLYETVIEDKQVRLCVMQYIDGQTLFESQTKLTGKEAIFLLKEAALINKIPLEPEFIYDSWAIVHFLSVWEERKQYLSVDDQKLILPLVQPFQQFDLKVLPHCFVHGDLIKTNVMRDRNDKLYILDFSVANYYPRIQELAVMLCDLLFDEQNLDLYDKVYKQALEEYQKYVPLEEVEIKKIGRA